MYSFHCEEQKHSIQVVVLADHDVFLVFSCMAFCYAESEETGIVPATSSGVSPTNSMSASPHSAGRRRAGARRLTQQEELEAWQKSIRKNYNPSDAMLIV